MKKLTWQTTVRTNHELVVEDDFQPPRSTQLGEADIYDWTQLATAGETKSSVTMFSPSMIELTPIDDDGEELTIVKLNAVAAHHGGEVDDYDYGPLLLSSFDLTEAKITGNDIELETGGDWEFRELFQTWRDRAISRGEYAALDWDSDDDVQGYVFYGARMGGRDGRTLEPISFKVGTNDGDWDSGFSLYSILSTLDLVAVATLSDGSEVKING